jgi:hypothetical protein
MRKKIYLSLGAIMLALVGWQAYAFSVETYIDYYYDDTFATWVGYRYLYCDGYVDTDNNVGSWRIISSYNCDNGNRIIHRCQQTDGMGGWINVGCPPWDP